MITAPRARPMMPSLGWLRSSTTMALPISSTTPISAVASSLKTDYADIDVKAHACRYGRWR